MKNVNIQTKEEIFTHLENSKNTVVFKFMREDEKESFEVFLWKATPVVFLLRTKKILQSKGNKSLVIETSYQETDSNFINYLYDEFNELLNSIYVF